MFSYQCVLVHTFTKENFVWSFFIFVLYLQMSLAFFSHLYNFEIVRQALLFLVLFLLLFCHVFLRGFLWLLGVFCCYFWVSSHLFPVLILRGDGGAVVSVLAWELRVPGSNPRYPLTTFQYLISSPSGQRLPKLLPYCLQMVLTTLICI